jgi:hypothetical protein
MDTTVTRDSFVRFIIFSWLLSLSPFTVADNQLPNCEGIYSRRKDTSYGNKDFWNACVGESTLELDSIRKKYFRYTGEFLNGDFNGYGVAKYEDGGEYRGFWKNSFPHGEGIFLFANGEKQAGTFSRGRLIEPAGERKIIENENHQEQAKIENDTTINKPSATKDGRRRIALVIGNAAYKNAPLRNPTNDSDLISKTLAASGFLVSRHDNLTYAKMREVVRTFGEKLSKGDVGLFYYSGHAVQYRGKNYLLPINEDLKHSDEIPSSAMDIDFVLAKMESAKNDLNIVVLDACRNNPLGAEARNIERGLTSVNAAKGTFIAFSTSPGNVALDGKGSNSPYTKNLAQAIRKGGMTLEQVFKEVRRNVISETNSQQVPWENSSILGDFYFK